MLFPNQSLSAENIFVRKYAINVTGEGMVKLDNSEGYWCLSVNMGALGW